MAGSDAPEPRPLTVEKLRDRRRRRHRAARAAGPRPRRGRGRDPRAETDGLPVEHVYLWASVAAMPDDLVERHVELVCTHLRPALAG